MPFNRPSLQELIARNEADVDTRFPGGDARLRNSALNVLARVNAGSAHGLYGFLEWLSRQILPDTADAEILARHAAWWNVVRRPASFAKGQVTITGSNGAIIPAGTLLRRADGVEYATDAEVIIAGGAVQAMVTATAAGAAGNAAEGVKLNFLSPVAGVNSQAAVAAGGLTGGFDDEDDESLRARLVERIRKPPQGGNEDDYVRWAKEVPGVTRVWVTREMGVGTVTVRFVMDDKPDTIIPSPAEVAAVQAHIDEPGVRPHTADVFVVAPIPKPLDLTIRLEPNTQAVRDAVTAELKDLLRRDSKPAGKILLSRIREAVSIAAGESDNSVLSPADDFVCGIGEIAVLGAITWQ